MPAIIVKRPRLFILPSTLPDDLDAVVRAIRMGRGYASFREVEPANSPTAQCGSASRSASAASVSADDPDFAELSQAATATN